MTAEIVRLGIATVPNDPDDILEKAKGQGISDVIVIGLIPGQPTCFSASTSDAERIVYMLEWAKRFIMDRAEEA